MTGTTDLWLSETEIFLLADGEIVIPGLEVVYQAEHQRSPWDVTYRVIILRTLDEEDEGDWKETWWEGFYRVGIAQEKVLGDQPCPLTRMYAGVKMEIVYKPWTDKVAGDEADPS